MARPLWDGLLGDDRRSRVNLCLMRYRLIDASVDFRGGVVLKYTVSGEQPGTGSVRFSTTFVSADGDHVEELGFELVDNRVVAAFSSTMPPPRT